jgi:hypothetical protein
VVDAPALIASAIGDENTELTIRFGGIELGCGGERPFDAHKNIADQSCPCRKSDPNVVMVKSCENWPRHYAANGLNDTRHRRIFVQG